MDHLTANKFFQAFGLGSGALLALYLYSNRVEPSALKVVTQRLKLPRMEAGMRGLRLVQFSDIHMGGWMNRHRLERVVEKVLKQNPDVVAITGDFIMRGSIEPGVFADLAAALAPLARQVKTVAVLGNHDHRYGLRELRELFAQTGIEELRNCVLTIRRGTAQLQLAGVDDIWLEADDLDGLLKQIPAQGAAVLLAHEPDFADIAAESGRFDLQISGHTHGGQISLPIFGPLALPGLGKRYPSGLYRVGEMLQYTNRGVGMGALPFRFNCPPEITVFILE